MTANTDSEGSDKNRSITEVFAEVSIDAHEAESFLRVDGWTPTDEARGSIGITVGWPVGAGVGRGYIAIAPSDAEAVANQLLEAVDEARDAGADA